jgi:DNA replication protein DnaC
MERTQLFDLMAELKLFSMRSAYDEVMSTGIKRQHEPPCIVGDLLQAEIAEKHARSIKYQMTIAKLPLAKDIDDFAFERLETEARAGRQGRFAEYLTRMDFVVFDGATVPARLCPLEIGICSYGRMMGAG